MSPVVAPGLTVYGISVTRLVFLDSVVRELLHQQGSVIITDAALPPTFDATAVCLTRANEIKLLLPHT